MNANRKLMVATVAGVAIGALAIETIRAQGKPPGYIVVEFEVTDPAGWKTYADAARALPGGGGTFNVRGMQAVALAGEHPKRITIVRFPNVDDAVAFDASPEYAALKANRDKSSNWRSYVVEGLAN